MKLRLWLPIAGVLAAGVAPLPASAAPLSMDAMRAAAGEEAGTTAVHYGGRRCYRHRGHWHCPRHVRRYHRYYDGPYYSSYREPYPYYYGSYGPSFGLYIGGGRGWGRRHW